jgi:NAD+ kinase
VRFALEIRAGRPSTEEFATRLEKELSRRGAELAADPESRPDMVLAVGGDGTMLAAVSRSVAWDVPVLGFNLGTLGFLAAAEPSAVEQVVERLLGGDYEIEERTTVRASTAGAVAVGINDVVVEKIDSTRLVSLDVDIDGSPFVTYRADGLIVATPTGSTAYSFSAGGPLVDPAVDALVVTPVASHSLFDRALVIPGDSELTVTVRRDRYVKVNVDKTALGQLGDGDAVTIRKGDVPARFVRLEPPSFAGLVREKFGLS